MTSISKSISKSIRKWVESIYKRVESIYKRVESILKYLCYGYNTFHDKTKHLRLNIAWIRDAIENNEIAMHYIPSKQNIADILTKPLHKSKFEYLRNLTMK